MAATNFAALTDEQLTIWERDTWEAARQYSWWHRFVGNSANSIIQRINTLKKDQKGTRAVITLVADLEGDGVAGDRNLEGNEEAMKAYDQVIQIDQLRHAVENQGRMADQASVVNFRKNAKDKLAYWLAERHDQMIGLALAGVPFTQRPNGAPRISSDLPSLVYAADITAPTAARRLRWNSAAGNLEPGASTNVLTAADKPTWKLLVQAKAYAKMHRIKGVNDSGEPVYHVFLSPLANAALKQDPEYMDILKQAQTRGDGNPLFTGNTVKVDGLYIHEVEHVYNTSGASGAVLIPRGGPLHSKWGATGDVDGCQMMLCGAQSLALADIGNPYWDEQDKDYENRQGIAVGKMSGLLKPKFYSQVDASIEDFSVLSIYVAQ